MISAVNSTRFASANNYKRTYTNTNQNTNQSAIGYQQSFGMKTPSRALTLVGTALLAIMPHFANAAGKAAPKAESGAKGLMQLMSGKVASGTKDAVALAAGKACSTNLNPTNKLEQGLTLIPNSLRADIGEKFESYLATHEFLSGWGIKTEALNAFKGLAKAAGDEGIEIKAKSGYARSGCHSPYRGVDTTEKMHTGNEIDIEYLDAQPSRFRTWLFGNPKTGEKGNAAKHGFESVCKKEEKNCPASVIRYNSDRNQSTLLRKLKGKKIVSADPSLEGLVLDFGKAGAIKHEDSITVITLPNAEGCWTTTTFEDGNVMAVNVANQVRMHKTPKKPQGICVFEN